MNRYIRNFLTGVFVYFFSLVIFIDAPSASGNSKNIQAVDRQVEKAVLVEDWGKVAKLLDSVTHQTPSPILRLIKGHATLALNRNNESCQLFSSISSWDEHVKWGKWTKTFVTKNSKNAIAHYFMGDALARIKNYDSAKNTLNEALKLHRNHPLILNDRGSMHAANNQLDLALLDFVKATRSDPSFADAHASLSTIWVHRKAAPKQALESFNKALKISPDFALALNGRACAEFALGHFDNSINDLKAAIAKTNWYSTPVANMATFALMKDELMLPIGNNKAKIKPGMSLEVVNKYVESLSEKQARTDAVLAEENLQRNKRFKKIVNALSQNIPREGNDVYLEVLNIGNQVKKLKENLKNSSPEERVHIQNEINYLSQKMLESLHSLVSAHLGNDSKNLAMISSLAQKIKELILIGGIIGGIWIGGDIPGTGTAIGPTVEETETEEVVEDDKGGAQGGDDGKKKKKKKKESAKPAVSGDEAKEQNRTGVSNPVIVIHDPDNGILITPILPPVPRLPGFTPIPPTEPPILYFLDLEGFSNNVENEKAFFENFQQTLVASHPELESGGVDAEGILRAYTDTGKWLFTEFGLHY